MKSNKKMAAVLAAVIGMGAAALSAGPASAQSPFPPGYGTQGPRHERHPELRRALASLERTEAQLRNSARDFGGHRAKAADLCHQAEEEIQLALQYDNN